MTILAILDRHDYERSLRPLRAYLRREQTGELETASGARTELQRRGWTCGDADDWNHPDIEESHSLRGACVKAVTRQTRWVARQRAGRAS